MDAILLFFDRMACARTNIVNFADQAIMHADLNENATRIIFFILFYGRGGADRIKTTNKTTEAHL